MAWAQVLRSNQFIVSVLMVGFFSLTCFVAESPAVESARIVVEWADNSSNPDLAGYRLYAGGVPVCISQDPASREMICDASLEGEVVSFTLASFDIHGNESEASVPFNLQIPANWPPVAENVSLEVNEDAELHGRLVAVDPDGDALVFSIIQEPGLGTVLLENEETGDFTYLPDPDANGQDSFIFQVVDIEGHTAQASLSVNISSVNDAPKANLDFLQARTELAVEVDLTANDTDLDGDVLEVTTVGTPIHGTVSLAGSVLHYESDPGFVGIDYLTYDVSDGMGGVATGYFVVNVQPINWVPMASNLALNTSVSVEVAGTLRAFDFDGDSLSFSINSNGFLGTATIEDAAVGTFRYVPEPGTSGVDMFTFQVSDGKSFSLPATVSVTINPNSILPAGMLFETGTVEAGDAWVQVALQHEYIAPVVVAFPVTMNDEEPGVVQVRNIDGAGFELHFQEWEYLDGVHELESIHYLVMEKGVYTLQDGTLVEAGIIDTDGGNAYDRFDFTGSFPEAPVVFASVQTLNQAEPVVGRLRKIDSTGFDYKLQSEEGASWEHASETVGYITWETSGGSYDDLTFEVVRTSDLITASWKKQTFGEGYAVEPLVIAGQQSADGGDTAGLRCRNLSLSGMEIQVDEEQSRDDEVYHTTETAGYLIVSMPDAP